MLGRAKVELGEADAALVYRTDAVSSAQVRVVPIPGPLRVHARYPIGLVVDTRRAREAIQFIDYVLSDDGRETLRRHGFVTEVE